VLYFQEEKSSGQLVILLLAGAFFLAEKGTGRLLAPPKPESN